MSARIQHGGRASRPSRLRRRVVVGAAILLGVAWFGASPAAATGETPGACMAEKIEALTFGGHHGGEALTVLVETAATGVDIGATEKLESFDKKLESCIEAPNPIIPELTEIIWGGIAFLILLVLMQWKLFPAVKRGMDRRAAKIRDDLDAAETARTEALGVKAGYEAELADARSESGRIVDAARADAERVRAELIARAEAEAAELRQRSDLDVEAAKRQALADLQGEVGAIVIGAAETVIGRNLDHDTQVQLIESYIDEVGSRN